MTGDIMHLSQLHTGSSRVPEQSEVVDEVAFLDERRRTALAEIDKTPFSRFHAKICLVAGIGFFTDAYDIFAITIAVEMLRYDLAYSTWGAPGTNTPTLSTWEVAGIMMATFFGNVIGQLLFGWLADILGRKRIYGIELMIMIIGTFGQAISGGGPRLNIVGILIFWRFIMGIGVGGDYPMSAIITSEFASTRIRGRMMTAVFAFQGCGQLAASLVGLAIVAAFKDGIEHSIDNVDYTWRLLIGLGCIPAVIALYFRLTVPETPRFTMDIDRRVDQAARDIRNALTGGYSICNDDTIHEPRVISHLASINDFIAYFSKFDNFKVLFGTAYSWLVLDIAFYTLTLNFTLNLTHTYSGPGYDFYKSLMHKCIMNLIVIVTGYIPGFVLSFLLIDSWGRKPIQLMGFVILAILFSIMSFYYDYPVRGNGTALTVLYCAANMFQNFGPNTTTFIIPGEVFPTRYRSTAYGISAAWGKLGAAIAQILVAATYGQVERAKVIMEVLSIFMLTGVISTLLIPETKQRTLEDLSNENQKEFITGLHVPASQV